MQGYLIFIIEQLEEEEKKSFLENLFFQNKSQRIPIDKIPGNEFEILKKSQT